MKILIVDDEIVTIKMLKTLIDWEKLGLELIGYANDGVQAYDILKNQKVDIILSDIRMANMNGIELIKKVSNLYEDVKFILMSAYADFEYAKEAMQLGCSNYILKPIDEIELEKTLRKVIEEIRGKEDKKRIVDSSIKKLQLFELYKYMKFGKNINSVLKDVNSYKIDFNNYYIVLIQQENSSMNDYMRVNSIELFHHKYIEKLLDEIIVENYKKNYVDFLFDDESCVLIVDRVKDEEITLICKNIQDKFLQEIEIKTKVFFSEKGKELSMLPILYEKLEKDILEKLDENSYEEKKYSEAVEKCLKIIERDYDKNLNFLKVSSQNDKKIESIRVGIASINFFTSLKEVLAGEQNLSIRRKEVSISLLNDAKKNSVKILIFPEISIPFQWLKILNEFSRKNGILIKGGLEHLCYYKLPYSSNEKYIFNNLFTILPFSSKNNYKTSITKVRLKNFYAPQEEKEIENSHCKVPKVCDKEYDIFSWQGVYFSNFNCYELTDIESRARLKNYIDLLVASVYNNDLEYFDNILKSTCRDLHVFIAQSNTSKFGDCEILQPTEKNRMIKCKVKSGLNYNLLVDEIEIAKLREFQLLKHSLQKERKDFKLTPPGINPDVVKARMNNELEKEL